MLRASHEGSQKVVVRTVITVRFLPGAAIAKSILYCAGQLVFKESGHHLTGTDTIYFVTVRLHMHNSTGNDSNLLIVFYVQIMPDDFVMQLHRF